MTTYKHIPPDKPEQVSWHHIKDWFTQEIGGSWDSMMKYTILKAYNNRFFPENEKIYEQVKPTVVKKTIRYLNRV